MKKIIKMIKLYLLSKDIWEAKMEDPILPRRPSPLEMESLKRKGIV